MKGSSECAQSQIQRLQLLLCYPADNLISVCNLTSLSICSAHFAANTSSENLRAFCLARWRMASLSSAVMENALLNAVVYSSVVDAWKPKTKINNYSNDQRTQASLTSRTIVHINNDVHPWPTRVIHHTNQACSLVFHDPNSEVLVPHSVHADARRA
jgi:hypothetical protein